MSKKIKTVSSKISNKNKLYLSVFSLFIVTGVSLGIANIYLEKAAQSKRDASGNVENLPEDECRSGDLITKEYVTIVTNSANFKIGYPNYVVWAQSGQPANDYVWMKEAFIPMDSEEDFNFYLTEQTLNPYVIENYEDITVNGIKATKSYTETEAAEYITYYIPIPQPSSSQAFYYVMEGRLPKTNTAYYYDLLNAITETFEILPLE